MFSSTAQMAARTVTRAVRGAATTSVRHWSAARSAGAEVVTRAAAPTVLPWLAAAAAAATAAGVACADSERDTVVASNWEKRQAKRHWAAAAPADARILVGGRVNCAFIFVKPHANTTATQGMVKSKLRDNGVLTVAEGDLDAATIDKDRLIDNHYGAIAAKAVKLKPSELNVPDKGKAAFQKAFGLSWEDALSQGLVYNAAEACEKLGVDGEGLDAKWSQLKRGTNLLKFGGGFYCGQVDGIYVMNGFYMQMRSAYTKPPATLHWYIVVWNPAELTWEDFRGKVLGATDPSQAAEGSLRRTILDRYEALGLTSKPNTGDNGVHGSASPLEALAERVNWTGAKVQFDYFGAALEAAGIPAETVAAWAEDPQVELPWGGKGSLFDAVEDLDSEESIRTLAAIYDANQ